jgi:hypothetical protein
MGHAIGLRLQSRIHGGLDIWAIYAPADTEVKRRKLWTTLLSIMKKDTLNVMAGDFNFVEHHGDRFRGDTHQFTGRGGSSEAKELKRLITDRFDMVELSRLCTPGSGGNRTKDCTQLRGWAGYTPAQQWAGLICRNPSATCCHGDATPTTIRSDSARGRLSKKRNPLVKPLPLWIAKHA